VGVTIYYRVVTGIEVNCLSNLRLQSVVLMYHSPCKDNAAIRTDHRGPIEPIKLR